MKSSNKIKFYFAIKRSVLSSVEFNNFINCNGALTRTRTANLLITNQLVELFRLLLCRILNDCGVTRQIKSHGTTLKTQNIIYDRLIEMKKILSVIFSALSILVVLTNTSFAAKKWEKGELKISDQVVDVFIEYIKGKHTKAPHLFAISKDGLMY